MPLSSISGPTNDSKLGHPEKNRFINSVGTNYVILKKMMEATAYQAGTGH